MDNTFTKFIEAYNTASDQTKNLINSEEIGLFIDRINTSSAKLQKKELMVLISNTILGVIKESELIEKLNNILALEDEVIAKVTDFTSQKIVSLSGNSPEITFKENTFIDITPTPLQTVRTMSSDSSAVHTPPKEETHSSVQSNILKGYQ